MQHSRIKQHSGQSTDEFAARLNATEQAAAVAAAVAAAEAAAVAAAEGQTVKGQAADDKAVMMQGGQQAKAAQWAVDQFAARLSTSDAAAGVSQKQPEVDIDRLTSKIGSQANTLRELPTRELHNQEQLCYLWSM